MYLTSISIEWEVDLGGCDTCDYSNGYTYTTNPGGVDSNATHTKAGICTVCGTEQILDKAEKCTFDEGVVTPPTNTENGYTTYTCVCGYSYTDNETPALNATKYTVSFSVPKAVEALSVLGYSSTDVAPFISTLDPSLPVEKLIGETLKLMGRN
jgi:hypothetical protein